MNSSRHTRQSRASVHPVLLGVTLAAASLSAQQHCTFREGFHVPAKTESAGAPLSGTVLSMGTPVRLRFPESVSSVRAAVGGPVALEVLEEVRVDGLPVILKRADAWAVLKTGTRKPAVHWEWWRYDDRDIHALFGHGGEFPVLHTRGELHLQVRDGFDITGGEVPLNMVATAIGEDADWNALDPAAAGYALPAVFFAEGVKRAIAKSLRVKPKWSFLSLLNGGNAIIPKDTEITAFVKADICYDTAFLRRVQEQMRITSAREASSPRPILAGACGISVQPHIARVGALPQDEDAPCLLRVMPPSEISGAPRNQRKEMRLVAEAEAAVARRIPHMTPREISLAGETALAWGRGLYAEGSEPSLREAIGKYREAIRYWVAVKEGRQHERTLDYLAAAYGALIVRLIERKDAEALRAIVAEAVEFDAATCGSFPPRLSGWNSVSRELTDATGGTP